MNQHTKKIKNSSIIFILLITIGVFVTLGSLSGNYGYLTNVQKTFSSTTLSLLHRLLPFLNKQANDPSILEPIASTPEVKCSSKKPILGLNESKDSTLKRLGELQQICESFATDTQMIFTNMPNSEINASRLGLAVATKLKEFSKFGVRPLVIVEPVTEWGPIDFEEFNSGFYNKWIESFFVKLKNEGVGQGDMGIWVPFPEANLPYWNRGSSKPELFGENVMIYFKLLRKYYPTTERSILLNSVSYAADDENWEDGRYTSLLPYVKTLKPGSVDSFGIQGFPWRSPKSEKNPVYIYDPLEFINPSLAVEAAKFLHVKKIWINTGTFRAKFTNDPGELVTEPPNLRAEILNEILNQADILKKDGFDVAINIFAENKTETNEATDWSYWGKKVTEADKHSEIFKDFISKLSEKEIGFWFFDR
ncbi:hypothetical protein IT417_02170 [bacterium]|nr:hypothetical protein [bacterium]